MEKHHVPEHLNPQLWRML